MGCECYLICARLNCDVRSAIQFSVVWGLAGLFCGLEFVAMNVSEGLSTMSLKAILFSVGCALAWFVLLPLLVIGGALALFSYAVFAEVASFLTGKPIESVDSASAREIARRMCGYAVERRSARRPTP